MDERGRRLYISGISCTFSSASMPTAARPLVVPFREVRHERPDDCLHYESVAVRGQIHHWTIPAHRHEGLHQFQLLERGTALASIDGRRQTVRAPALLMMAPGCVHGFEYSPDTVGHQITVPSAMLSTMLEGAGELRERLANSFIRDAESLVADVAECAALFAALRDEFHSVAATARVQALTAYATLITVWFLRNAHGSATPQARHVARDTLVQRFRKLIETHFREHRTLGFYASQLDVTPDHLSRMCRQLTGRSALDLLHDRLVIEARRLLSYTPASVVEIAHMLGYDDPAYFNKFFSRAVGQAPGAYRESIQFGTRS